MENLCILDLFTKKQAVSPPSPYYFKIRDIKTNIARTITCERLECKTSYQTLIGQWTIHFLLLDDKKAEQHEHVPCTQGGSIRKEGWRKGVATFTQVENAEGRFVELVVEEEVTV